MLCQPGTLSCYTKILSVLALTGTYVDAQIVPGFYYRVRRVGGDNDDYLFNGEPRQLMSVGMGYGKRVTFKGDNALDNSDFYFYSDTEQEGTMTFILRNILTYSLNTCNYILSPFYLCTNQCYTT